ncbi:MAG: putative N-acetylglucosamine-6-phosphate deacetylase [Thermoleophilia bacterium]|nr:putative N-acetylglucosamine-6-phosphate deacetylase [Thermoleophilia bacterium]
MAPGRGQTLHLESSRVLLDGALVPARVQVRVDEHGHGIVESIESSGAAPAGAATSTVDVGDSIIAPAPLDLHFHGAGGHVVPPAGEVAAIDAALRGTSAAMTDPRSGLVTRYAWLATLPIPLRPVPDPAEHLRDAARAIAGAGAGHGCLGLRLEGCFLSPSRAGVWPPETFHDPDPALLDRLADAALDGGTPLRIIDVAPELPGAAELIAHARARGIIVSLAHTDATWEEALDGIDAGATMATHTWNAMRPVAHRDPGVVAASIVDPRVTCELICDGVHLHPGTVALTVAASRERGEWVAISDASPFAGCEPGRYEWAGTTVQHDGTALRDPHGNLAGSAALLDAALPVLDGVGIDPVAIVIAMGARPRQLLEPARTLGLQPGDDVWLVELRPRSGDTAPPG